MNIDNIKQALKIANDAQHRHDATVTPEKHDAKKRAAAIVRLHLSREENVSILDVGGEKWYAEYFPHMETLNLPQDIHALTSPPHYDVIIAMHLLEHSPFPLLALLNIYDALKPDGFVYIAVPRPVEPFLTLPSHFTVLTREGWEKLFKHAGFGVTFTESGRFGNYDPAVEERFVCIKGR